MRIRRQALNRALGLAGLLGGIGALLNNLSFPGWGNPGTLAYERYEAFNHRMELVLLLMTAGMLGFSLSQWPVFGRLGRAATVPVFLGLAAMLAGNVAEFWFFTEQPYGQANLRDAAWSLFVLGQLVQLLGSLALGLDAWRRRRLPRWIAILLLAWLPADIIAFFAGPLLTAAGVITACLGAWLAFAGRAVVSGARPEPDPELPAAV